MAKSDKGTGKNSYEGMIHHGEGGMKAPGACPLTCGSGTGSKTKSASSEKGTA